MFETRDFIADCQRALKDSDPNKAVHEIVARAVANPDGILKALGEPKRGEVQRIHAAPDLTIINVLWAPGMYIHPHNHEMWAVIGVYGGQEDNTFYRRLDGGGVEAAGEKILATGDAVTLGEKAIHAVTNRQPRITAAIHVYGGQFFETPRSEWDPDSLEERPYDVARNMALFEEANARMHAAQ